MTTESRLKAQVELFLSEKGYIPLRLNVGLFYTKNGYPIRTGLPKGCSDIIAIQPGTGRAVFVETKVRPRKPTAEQLKFIEVMRKQGAIAGVVYDLEDLKKLLQTY